MRANGCLCAAYGAWFANGVHIAYAWLCMPNAWLTHGLCMDCANACARLVHGYAGLMHGLRMVMYALTHGLRM
eukprot:10390343-Lingulodinium_polyedra.AAC.1